MGREDVKLTKADSGGAGASTWMPSSIVLGPAGGTGGAGVPGGAAGPGGAGAGVGVPGGAAGPGGAGAAFPCGVGAGIPGAGGVVS